MDSAVGILSYFWSYAVMKRPVISVRWLLRTLIAVITTMTLLVQFRLLWSTPLKLLESSPTSSSKQEERCAINFWGLPRAFESLVLPSIVKNVILPNAPYHCDYFVHYYNLTYEPPGRAKAGGTLNPEEVRLLQKLVENEAPNSVVLFASDREEDFWKQHDTLIQKIRNDKDDRGRYLYFPWKANTYKHPESTDNIIKMWHSIQASWQLMEDYGNQHGIEYTRVAMLRSDVVYVTPIDIFQKQRGQNDTDNKFAVVPGFGRFPVNDRLVYGPARAVRVWATQRFDRLEGHVQYILNNNPGWGLHSEGFVNLTLFPAMQREGVEIVEHDTLCFFRARADDTVLISDCRMSSKPTIMQNLGRDNRKVVEGVLGRNCSNVTPVRGSLHCPRKG